eukprot:2275955-Pleurochrysis_carterae.AAC.3
MTRVLAAHECALVCVSLCALDLASRGRVVVRSPEPLPLKCPAPTAPTGAKISVANPPHVGGNKPHHEQVRPGILRLRQQNDFARRRGKGPQESLTTVGQMGASHELLEAGHLDEGRAERSSDIFACVSWFAALNNDVVLLIGLLQNEYTHGASLHSQNAAAVSQEFNARTYACSSSSCQPTGRPPSSTAQVL